MSGPIGPSLPPGFAAQQREGDESDEDEPRSSVRPFPPENVKTADLATSVGPVIGPGMPPQSIMGPCMAPQSTTVDSHSYGPALPPEFSTGLSPEQDLTTPTTAGDRLSPTHSESEESDEEVIGPMPNTTGTKVIYLG